MYLLPKNLNQLPSKYVHLCLNIKNFITKDLDLNLKGKKLLLAVSGGADSTAMLCILNILSNSMKFSISVCHLNHGLRPEANIEYKFVQSICVKNHIPFFGGKSKINVYAKSLKIGIEESARIIRYRFLQGIKNKTCSDYIVTAHHLNDLAEDILMRLIRGAGWPSLGGMKAIDNNTKILRPLLLTPKKKLKDLLKELGIKWHEDLSNYDMKYKRNRIRHKLLPVIFQENSNFLEVAKHLWFLSQIDATYFEKNYKKFKDIIKTYNNYIIVPRIKIISWEQSIRLRFYGYILSNLGKGQVMFSNLINLDKCIISYTGPKTIQFPGNKRVEVSYKKIKFIASL